MGGCRPHWDIRGRGHSCSACIPLHLTKELTKTAAGGEGGCRALPAGISADDERNGVAYGNHENSNGRGHRCAAVAATVAVSAAVVHYTAAGGAAAPTGAVQPGTAPTQPAAVADGNATPSDWDMKVAAFRKAYSLQKGEILKRIAPPYIAEREYGFMDLRQAEQAALANRAGTMNPANGATGNPMPDRGLIGRGLGAGRANRPFQVIAIGNAGKSSPSRTHA